MGKNVGQEYFMKKTNGGKWNKYLVAGLLMTGLAVLLGLWP